MVVTAEGPVHQCSAESHQASTSGDVQGNKSGQVRRHADLNSRPNDRRGFDSLHRAERPERPDDETTPRRNHRNAHDREPDFPAVAFPPSRAPRPTTRGRDGGAD